MKRNFLKLAIIVLIAATGCQKNLTDNQLNHDQLGENAGLRNVVVDCTPISLSGTINTNTTLLSGKRYILDGIVDVKNATLTIQPGTLIEAKTSVASGLVIDKTAQINAVGTSTNPIVFTSDKAPGARAPGDWIGLAIMGNAPNNQSNALGFSFASNSYTAGGTSVSSSAGTLEYVQINFAGKGSATGDRLTQSALILGSVGNGMTIKDVQISESKFDGLGVWGGQVGIKEVFSYKSGRTDLAISQGYRGNIQNILGFKDNAIFHIVESYGIDITNNLVGADNAPYTYPVISNVSLMGGTFCENSDIGYEDAIAIRKNGSAQIYNTVVEGFNRYGLFLEGSNIIAKTKSGTDQLIFSNNSLHDLGSPEYSQQFTSPHASWAAADGCRLNPSGTMQNWIEGTALSSCNQTGNQFSLLATGYYKNSLCGDKCSTFPNLFINESTTDLEAPDYGMLSGFFDQPAFRGALQTSANTWLKSTWVDFCMLTRNYCE
ncbi:MAG: hypothetical protein BGO31_07630 [Bacteroidetes bacterium 43-16]|nr:MAG: hypothetical protein BGO31_07630 [Bacteroidetes bacterium 43-16]